MDYSDDTAESSAIMSHGGTAAARRALRTDVTRRGTHNGGRALSLRAPPVFHGGSTLNRAANVTTARSRDRSPIGHRPTRSSDIHMTRDKMQKLEAMIEQHYTAKLAVAERRLASELQKALDEYRMSVQTEAVAHRAQLQAEAVSHTSVVQAALATQYEGSVVAFRTREAEAFTRNLE